MMKPNNTRLCARAAIAAALALASTPLLAQFAETPTTVAPAPVPVTPETWSPPPAQPTIVLPTELQKADPPAATVTAPEPAPAATTTTTTTTRTERVTRTAAPSPAARVDVADPASVSVAEDLTSVPTAAIAEPANEIVVSEPTVAETPSNNNDGALLFGLAAIAAIAALVLAIWGFIAIGRRKPADRKAAAIVERPAVTPHAPQPAPVMAEPVYVAQPLSTFGTTAVTPAPSLAHSGAAIPLPRTIPPTFAERDALLRRMIAAKPDRANPFTTHKARLKRARLIIQSLGNEFSDRKPWIDLSQYPGNWPELSRSESAAA